MTISSQWRRIVTIAVAAAVTFTTASTAISAAPSVPGDQPVLDTDAHPKFSWSMPERYDASWAAYRAATGTYRPGFVTPAAWSIRLDACDSTAIRQITGYVFRINKVGSTWSRTFRSRTCKARYDALPSLGRYDVRLSLNTNWRPSVGVSRQVHELATLKDHLIVSMGDSLASGEGNPDVRGDYGARPPKAAVWRDRRCHRSARSGPARAARAVERADAHSSVTFISVACSGAKIRHVSHRRYSGIAGAGFLFPPQVKQVADLVGPQSTRGGRRINAILMSAGVNDLYFSGVIRRCAKFWTGTSCLRMPDRRSNLAGLPASYHHLAREIAAQLPNTARVLVNNYPAYVFKNGGCGALRGITSSKGKAIARLGVTLNKSIATATRRHLNAPYRWRAVPDLTAPFKPHPYCGGSTWFTRFEWSLRRQGDLNGTAHPNGPGHRAYRDILNSALQGVL
ncbi:hypothetical protein KV097_07230 [Mumia sp. zg.B17]|uniref:GDSL-type esterase/lipase family protein n=1 Tax=Mumia sp. zg.B17 TaxID=2855446 RepID=UPI001C6E25FD|nr:GDSL-type esterase/lipase family protein [Mumia sp. zg.B17]MBW9205736.1 hypothetical protein [Mumia sp. zg.B17]